MAFTFRLERVLSVRRIQEEAAQTRHAQALEELRRAESLLSDLFRRLEDEQRELDGLKHRDELSPEALHLHSLHVAGLRRQIQSAAAACTRASDELDRAGAELMEAHRACEALEKLREREHEAWRKEQARREARDIDETAVTRYRAREEENHGP